LPWLNPWMASPRLPCVSLPQLETALEASWDSSTAFAGASQAGNPALGQCYPTARIVQRFFPRFDIAVGEVDTGTGIEAHFRNIDCSAEPPEHVDLTWQQFPTTSRAVGFQVLDRNTVGDSPPTVLRCRLLLQRVLVAWDPGISQRGCKRSRKAALSASERR
jgi:hypothetical protein